MNFAILFSAIFFAWTTVNTPVTVEDLSGPVAIVETNKWKDDEALKLVQTERSLYWHVQSGGNQPQGELQTFRPAGSAADYYYLGSDIDTEAKLLAYFQQAYTKSAAQALLDEMLMNKELIKDKGKLAKINADKGSLLDWDRAGMKLVKQTPEVKQIQFNIPIGESGEWDKQLITFRKVDGSNWRIDDIWSDSKVIELARKGRIVYWHIQNGGNKPAGELKTFQPSGSDYDYYYLGSDIDTEEKFIAYLEQAYTKSAATAYLDQLLQNKFLVKHNGKLAKIDADKGSLADWERAKPILVNTKAFEVEYKLRVPFGEDDFDCATYRMLYQYVDGSGWRIAGSPEAGQIGTCPIPGAVKLTLEQIHKNAKKGLSYEQVQKLFGKQFSSVLAAKDGADMWRYDVTDRDDYLFNEEYDDVDIESIAKGAIGMQLFIGWSADGKTNQFIVYYKKSDGRVYEDRFSDGTWTTKAIQ